MLLHSFFTTFRCDCYSAFGAQAWKLWVGTWSLGRSWTWVGSLLGPSLGRGCLGRVDLITVWMTTSKQQELSSSAGWNHIQGGPKIRRWHTFCTPSNFIKYWPIFKLFHCQNQEKICNNTITKDSTASRVCRYTTLWNVTVVKATTENKTTSVATHFKSASFSSKANTLKILCKTAGCDGYFTQ